MSWTDNPEYLRKGMEFENFTASLFPDAKFDVLFRSDEKGTKVPDFYLRDRRTRYKFWVEAKYRDRPVGDKIDVYENKPDRRVLLRVFQEIVIPETVFLILGVGGSASFPGELFRLPIRELEYSSPYRKALEGWKIDASPFTCYKDGFLIQ